MCPKQSVGLNEHHNKTASYMMERLACSVGLRTAIHDPAHVRAGAHNPTTQRTTRERQPITHPAFHFLCHQSSTVNLRNEISGPQVATHSHRLTSRGRPAAWPSSSISCVPLRPATCGTMRLKKRLKRLRGSLRARGRGPGGGMGGGGAGPAGSWHMSRRRATNKTGHPAMHQPESVT